MITIPPGVGVEYLTRISNLLNHLYRDKSLGEISLVPLIEVRDEMIQNREFLILWWMPLLRVLI